MLQVRFVLLLASVSTSLTYALDICEYQLNGTRLAHPGDCNKFVVCKNGRTQNIRNCPIGLHFNRFKGVCDLKERAACDFEFVQLADRELDCSDCCTVCGCDSTSGTPTAETPKGPETPTPETPGCSGTPTPETPGSSDNPTPITPESPGTPTPEIPVGPVTPTSVTPEGPGTPTPEIPVSPVTPTPVTPEGPGTPTPEIPVDPVTPPPETPEGPGTPTPEIPEGPGTPTPETPEGPGTPTPVTPEGPGTPTPESPIGPSTPIPETPVTPQLNCGNNFTDCVGKPDGSVSYVSGTCNQYIVCVGGCANILSCPNNMQYNLATNQCDHPQNVNCPWQAKPPTTGPSGVACAQPGKCAGKPDGTLLPDPNSNGYIVCQCECEIERPCPAGTKFNEKLQVCGHIRKGSSGNNEVIVNENNNGGNGNGNDGGNSNGGKEGNVIGNSGGSANENNGGNDGNNGGNTVCTNSITACQNQTDGTQLPVQEKCNKFYVCNYNCAVEIPCPNNLIYNPNKKYCDYPQNYKCPWPYTTLSEPNAGPSGIACATGGRCVGKADGTFFPSNENQSKYVICQCECEVELNCPAAMVWNNKLLTCDYPANDA